jgi:hypothetical protein
MDFETYLNVDDEFLMLIVDDNDDVNERDLDYVDFVLLVVLHMYNLLVLLEQKDSVKNLHHHLNQLLNLNYLFDHYYHLKMMMMMKNKFDFVIDEKKLLMIVMNEIFLMNYIHLR